MPICHKYKCIFIHIPKTGGTSVVKALTKACGVEKAGDCMDFWGKIKKGRYGLDSMRGLQRVHEVEWPYQRRATLFHHLPALHMKTLIDDKIWNSYTKFAVIRNPFDPWVSFYEYYRQTGGRLNTENKDFKEWFYTENFQPVQWPYILDLKGNIMVDKLIRFESLNEDIESFFKDQNIPYQTLGHEKKTDRSIYRDYYNHDMQLIARKILNRDLNIFNYSF